MFWTLLMCHFVADYPLQTDAVVQAKKRLPGLLWHVTIHLVVMLVVIVGLLEADWRIALPWMLALTACHFLIDLWKNILSKLQPSWGVFNYLQDQALHLLSIAGLTYWMKKSGDVFLVNEPSWAIPVIGYVLVTHAWFVTERLLFFHKDPAYRDWVNAQSLSRMIGRAVLFSALFVGWNLWGLMALVGGLLYHWWDLAGAYRFRALVTDVLVVAMVMALSGSASA